jgi:hypothetical protein
MSIIAMHSNKDALAMTKKFLWSLFENLPVPSAIFNGTLNAALDN